MLRLSLLCVLLLSTSLSAADFQREALQGEWSLVAMTNCGIRVEQELCDQTTLTIRGNPSP